MKNYSRNYNRLKQHNGVETRLPEKKKYIIGKKKNKSKEDYIDYIINENNNLKKIINTLRNKSDQDSIFDIAIFLITGIFIIFLLDVLTTNIKKL